MRKRGQHAFLPGAALERYRVIDSATKTQVHGPAFAPELETMPLAHVVQATVRYTLCNFEGGSQTSAWEVTGTLCVCGVWLRAWRGNE